MRYHVHEGAKIKKRNGWKAFFIVVPILGLFVGGYVLINVFSPMLIEAPGEKKSTQERLGDTPGTHGNRLYIPQINVDVAILEGASPTILDKGAWHRNPDNGNPVEGGNFVLSAHRFVMGMTPGETRRQSPFYNLDKLQIGNELFVDYEGERYGYKIIDKQSVKPNQTEIEAPSDEDKLTLYSCTLRGSADGRDVIIAEPLGKVEKLQLSQN